ncbi:MAG: hypothetical protein WBE13_20920 [Candidatus Acidiferrum sp.]
MTLVNGFRTRTGGILLCADRQEDDGYLKAEIDKIYEIPHLMTCEVFIAGAGPSELISKAKEHIHKSLLFAAQGTNDVLAEHQTIIEGSLRHIYEEYRDVFESASMGLIIVVAPRAPGAHPLMYSTVEYRLDLRRTYCAQGTGRSISDYFSDRVYKETMNRNELSVLGAFILGEAERKAVGVGMGFDMVFINDGEQGRQYLGRDTIKKLQADIPPLSAGVFAAWNQSPAIQEWLKRTW